jgi:hypothetical protein
MANVNTSETIQTLEKEALAALNKLADALTESVKRKIGQERLKSLPIPVTGLPPTYGILPQMLIAAYRIGQLEATDAAAGQAHRTA